MRKMFRLLTAVIFLWTSLVPPSMAQGVVLPTAQQMITLTPDFAPCLLRGIKLDPRMPLRFDFIVDEGDTHLQGAAFESEAQRLIKYFLATLTTPEKDLWVNLSPYENNRIIQDDFGRTAMGRDLLAQDYILKQLTASLMHPDGTLGKKFWAEVYRKAQEKFGTTDIPVDTFNKVWIVPQHADVYEKKNPDGTMAAFVEKARLKVMLESDYLAAEKSQDTGHKAQDGSVSATQELAKEVVRSVILPALEKEVNSGSNFAQLRQVYHSLLLAVWLKKKLQVSTIRTDSVSKPKGHILSLLFVDQKKTGGIETDNPKAEITSIYDHYVEAFKAGAYNLIREDYDAYSQEAIPRKYFSGGAEFTDLNVQKAMAILPASSFPAESAMQEGKELTVDLTGVEKQKPPVEAELLIDVDKNGYAVIGQAIIKGSLDHNKWPFAGHVYGEVAPMGRNIHEQFFGLLTSNRKENRELFFLFQGAANELTYFFSEAMQNALDSIKDRADAFKAKGDDSYKGKIIVTARVEEENGKKNLFLFVRDNGAGVSPDWQKRSTKGSEQRGGLGVGFAASELLMKSFKGTCELLDHERDLGELESGATIKASIPIDFTLAQVIEAVAQFHKDFDRKIQQRAFVAAPKDSLGAGGDQSKTIKESAMAGRRLRVEERRLQREKSSWGKTAAGLMAAVLVLGTLTWGWRHYSSSRTAQETLVAQTVFTDSNSVAEATRLIANRVGNLTQQQAGIERLWKTAFDAAPGQRLAPTAKFYLNYLVSTRVPEEVRIEVIRSALSDPKRLMVLAPGIEAQVKESKEEFFASRIPSVLMEGLKGIKDWRSRGFIAVVLNESPRPLPSQMNAEVARILAAVDGQLDRIPYELVFDNTGTMNVAIAFEESAKAYAPLLKKLLTGTDPAYPRRYNYILDEQAGRGAAGFVVQATYGNRKVRIVAGTRDYIAAQKTRLGIALFSGTSTRSHNYEAGPGLEEVVRVGIVDPNRFSIYFPGSCAGSTCTAENFSRINPAAESLTRVGTEQGFQINHFTAEFLDRLARGSSTTWSGLKREVVVRVPSTAQNRTFPQEHRDARWLFLKNPDQRLFPGASEKAMQARPSAREIEEKIYAVHGARTLPKNGAQIAGRVNVRENEVTDDPNSRITLHFALGGLITPDPTRREGQGYDYAIVSPLKNLKQQLVNVFPTDTFILGDYHLQGGDFLVVPLGSQVTGLAKEVKIVYYDPKKEDLRGAVKKVISENSDWDIQQSDKFDIGGKAILGGDDISSSDFFRAFLDQNPHVSFGTHLGSETGWAGMFGVLDHYFHDVLNRQYQSGMKEYYSTVELKVVLSLIEHSLSELDRHIMAGGFPQAVLDYFQNKKKEILEWLNIVRLDIKLRDSGRTIGGVSESFKKGIFRLRKNPVWLKRYVLLNSWRLSTVSVRASRDPINLRYYFEIFGSMTPVAMESFLEKLTQQEGVVDRSRLPEFYLKYVVFRWLNIKTVKAREEGLDKFLIAKLPSLKGSNYVDSLIGFLADNLSENSNRLEDVLQICQIPEVVDYLNNSAGMTLPASGARTLEDFLKAHPKTRDLFSDGEVTRDPRWEILRLLGQDPVSWPRHFTSFYEASRMAEGRELIFGKLKMLNSPMNLAQYNKSYPAGYVLNLYESLRQSFGSGRSIFEKLGFGEAFIKKFGENDEGFWSSHQSFWDIYQELKQEQIKSGKTGVDLSAEPAIEAEKAMQAKPHESAVFSSKDFHVKNLWQDPLIREVREDVSRHGKAVLKESGKFIRLGMTNHYRKVPVYQHANGSLWIAKPIYSSEDRQVIEDLGKTQSAGLVPVAISSQEDGGIYYELYLEGYETLYSILNSGHLATGGYLVLMEWVRSIEGWENDWNLKNIMLRLKDGQIEDIKGIDIEFLKRSDGRPSVASRMVERYFGKNTQPQASKRERDGSKEEGAEAELKKERAMQAEPANDVDPLIEAKNILTEKKKYAEDDKGKESLDPLWASNHVRLHIMGGARNTLTITLSGLMVYLPRLEKFSNRAKQSFEVGINHLDIFQDFFNYLLAAEKDKPEILDRVMARINEAIVAGGTSSIPPQLKGVIEFLDKHPAEQEVLAQNRRHLEEIRDHYLEIKRRLEALQKRVFPDMVLQAPAAAKATQAEPVMGKEFDKGGIDLNTDRLDMMIRGNAGNFDIDLTPEQLQMIKENVTGFVPVIIRVQPVKSVPMFLGMGDNAEISS